MLHDMGSAMVPSPPPLGCGMGPCVRLSIPASSAGANWRQNTGAPARLPSAASRFLILDFDRIHLSVSAFFGHGRDNGKNMDNAGVGHPFAQMKQVLDNGLVTR